MVISVTTSSFLKSRRLFTHFPLRATLVDNFWILRPKCVTCFRRREQYSTHHNPSANHPCFKIETGCLKCQFVLCVWYHKNSKSIACWLWLCFFELMTFLDRFKKHFYLTHSDRVIWLVSWTLHITHCCNSKPIVLSEEPTVCRLPWELT